MPENNNGAPEEPGFYVELSSSVYDLEAIKRAAYRFSDRVVSEIVLDGETVKCHLVAVTPAAAKNLHNIENEFRVEVLDQDLRLKIAVETEPMRNLILSLAFSKTGLQE